MIEMLEGVPGSGKSYYAVSERLLKWVRAGRRLYVFVEGFYPDRLAMFEGIAQAELEKQITVWNTADEVRQFIRSCDPGSAIFIDEVQSVFRSKEKVDADTLRWLETHRHRGIDIVMMCQQYGQVTLGVNRLIEVTTKFRRLDRFGLKNRYQASVRGNPDETEIIRMFSGKYEPKMYAYYASYSHAGVRETRRTGSVMKSPTLIVGVIGLLGAVAWFGAGRWLTPSADVHARHAGAGALMVAHLPPPPSTVPDVSPSALSQAAPEIHPIRVQGGMCAEVDGRQQWLYVTESGQIMSDDQIAAESGGIVNARMDRGARILWGSGVLWGGVNAVDGGQPGSIRGPAMSHEVQHGQRDEGVPQEQSTIPGGSGSSNPLATPAGIL